MSTFKSDLMVKVSLYGAEMVLMHEKEWTKIGFKYLAAVTQVRIQRGDSGSGPPWKITTYMGLYWK